MTSSTILLHLTTCRRHDDVVAFPLLPDFIPVDQGLRARISP